MVDSLPCAYIGLDVIARCGGNLVEIYYQEKLIKSHIRAENKGTWVTDEKDYPKRVRAFLDMDDKACLSEAKSIGKSTFKVCEQILVSPSITSLRKAQGILRLATKHTPDRLEAACKRALSHNNIEQKCIKKILENKLDEVGSDDETAEVIKVASGGYTRDPKYFANY